MLSDIKSRAEKAIAGKVFPGCVIGIVRSDGVHQVLPFGYLTYDADASIVREDTIYDLASVTKSIPVASLVLMFIAEGKMQLADKVVKYLPELRNDHGATIEDLLAYRVRGIQLSTLKDKTADEIVQYVFAHGFEASASTSQYTNLPAFLLGLIVERVEEESLSMLAQKYFFDHLEMSHTTFFPNVRPTRSNIASAEVVDGEEVWGIVHDESARVFAKEGRTVGHAGLFSTAPDILNFLEALLQGKYPYVSDGAQKGMGWQLRDQMIMGQFATPGTFGKTGFTGTSVVVDMERGIGFVILSNRTYPKRPTDATAINEFRADIADILFR